MQQPNIAFIVLDDMGFSDLGCFGAEIDTHNLDALAAESVRFNNFNACPACSPTRASLLSGREHNSVGMGNIANLVLGERHPEMQGRIRHEAGTIAQTLRENGYSTLAIGKWHAAPIHHETPAGPFDYWPLGKGFERYYGYLDGETDQYAPQLIYDNHAVDPPRREDYHLTSDIVDKAIEFVSDSVSVHPDKPFFLYLCYGVAHSPHQVPREFIERYRGRYDAGWDVIREERFQRQKAMGIVPENAVCTPRDPDVVPWEELDERRKKLYARFQETYAGYVTHCDEETGRLLDFLREIDAYENTVFVVLSDNGASRDGGTEGIDDFYRTLNGVSPCFEDLFARIEDIGGPELKALYPKGWAMVGNTPFKEYKGTSYGGGVRTPMFVRWNTAAQVGQIRSQLVGVEDVYPTVLDILGLEAPTQLAGVQQMPIHGKSFLASLRDPAEPGRDHLFRRWVNSFCMIERDWKAISIHRPGNRFEDDPWELYDLREDFAESRNVAEEHPEVLERLRQRWWSEAGQYLQLPLNELTPRDFAYQPPDSPEFRKHTRYLPKMGRIGSMADPHVENRNHSIRARFTRSSAEQEGVLVAAGGVSGGYSLFVLDGRAYFDLNNFYTHYLLRSPEPLPLGDCELEFRFKKVDALPEAMLADFPGDPHSRFLGIGTLLVNGQEVGARSMETVRQGYAIEGTDVGRDSMTPVSPLYKDRGDFPFTGKLLDVCIDID